MAAPPRRTRKTHLRDVALSRIGSTEAPKARRAGIYTRISQDRDGDGLGVQRQREDCEREAKRRGWEVAAFYEDNDKSASRGPVRPQYERMLQDARDGVINAVVVYNIDRLTRRMSELEQFIDLARVLRLDLANVAGDIDLSTANGQTMAYVMGGFAKGEVLKMSERIKRGNQQLRERGQWLGGTRPFGWDVVRRAVATGTHDGKTEERSVLVVNADEREEVLRASQAIVQGASLGSIAADFNERGVLTTTGRRWSATPVRQMLLRARNAGLIEHEGALVGNGDWDALVPEELWRAVESKLLDDGRTPKVSNAARHLLSGIALCGECGHTVKSATATSRKTAAHPAGQKRGIYRCGAEGKPAGSHPMRRSDLVDEVVVTRILLRLAHSDPADLLNPSLDAEQARLADDAIELRARIEELTAAYVAGQIDMSTLADGQAQLRRRLEDVESQRLPAQHALVLGDVVGKAVDDLRALWNNDLTLARRREIVSTLAEVKIHKAVKGRVFDPSLIEISWR